MKQLAGVLYLAKGVAVIAARFSMTFWQIGTDLGLMNSPVALTSLVLAPGERADVLVDFSRVIWWWHGKVIVRNSANTPFPNGLPPTAGTTDRVMAFSVSKPLGFFGQGSAALTSASLPTNLRPVHGPLTVPSTVGATVRKLMLFEGNDAYGRLQTMLGTVNPAPGNPAGAGFGTFLYTDPVTETIANGSTEIWELYNTTVDAHPIHLHLVDFRVLDRQGAELLGPTTIALSRPIDFNETQLLAKEQEEALLYKDMQTDLVQQMMPLRQY